jgi:hypothetical protein
VEALGRLFNVAPVASGVAISLKETDGVTFVCTGSDTFSLTIATTFGGTYRAGSFFTPAWTPISSFYTATATDGTAVWTKSTITAADNTGAVTGMVAVFLSADALPDGYTYVKCTKGAAGLVTAITSDLAIQRSPIRLLKMSA